MCVLSAFHKLHWAGGGVGVAAFGRIGRIWATTGGLETAFQEVTACARGWGTCEQEDGTVEFRTLRKRQGSQVRGG